MTILEIHARNLQALGGEIKARRRARGWTQSDLACLVGLSRDGLMRIEKGRYYPTLKTVRRLNRVLD